MNELLDKLYKKTGGFIKGICHPNDNYDVLKDAGLRWVRRDIPYPFDKEGNISDEYISYKERCIKFAENGINCINVTPYPSAFLRRGIDVTTEEGLMKAGEVCAFIAKDYKEMKSCWQITNEMHVRHFRSPLNEIQAKDFIIACMKGFKKGDPDAVVGHNSIDRVWMDHCVEIDRECDCDFTGVDLYDGTWSNGGPDTFIPWVEEIYSHIKKPIIFMEFGFNSNGGVIEDVQAEADSLAQNVGFKNFEDAMANMDAFIDTFPEPIKRRILHCVPEDRPGCVMQSMLHIAKKWYTDCKIPHTEEGQAEFYRQLLPKLLNHSYVGGAVIYCLKDSIHCFFCDQPDCPCETTWGILHNDETPKPAYDVIKQIFND
ncbi:MAG: hypothetical protein E7481_08910 [Ruminococcaceae bacterium]|nr:hypothetical protein [Oscillospiraceae bacterium]